MAALASLGIAVPHLDDARSRSPTPIPLRRGPARTRPTTRRTSQRFWRVLRPGRPVLKEFRGRFIGKCSPVHFFWGSFDLAVTRFSGRPARRGAPGADAVTREAYSHEVISAGFWPGGAARHRGSAGLLRLRLPRAGGLAGAARSARPARRLRPRLRHSSCRTTMCAPVPTPRDAPAGVPPDHLRGGGELGGMGPAGVGAAGWAGDGVTTTVSGGLMLKLLGVSKWYGPAEALRDDAGRAAGPDDGADRPERLRQVHAPAAHDRAGRAGRRQRCSFDGEPVRPDECSPRCGSGSGYVIQDGGLFPHLTAAGTSP